MMAVERGSAPKTLEAYRTDLTDASAFAKSRGVALEAASESLLSDWLQDLSRRELSAASQKRRRSALRQFFQFELAEGRRPDDPTVRLDAAKGPKALPKTLTPHEVQRLLAAALLVKADEAGAPSTSGIRAHLAVELLYSTGLRASELVGLSLASLPRDGDGIVIKGKGNRERLILLRAQARAAIERWLKVRDQYLPDGPKRALASKWLFPSRTAEADTAVASGDC
jgi:integrase/recombinase XerD